MGNNNALVICPNILSERDATRTPQARLEEAVGLTEAIHLHIIQALIYPVRKVNPATLLGSGQIEAIAELVQEHEIEVTIFDCALSPMQQRNLERGLKAKVIDRSALILEIFGERAQTREGTLQVELAALEYQKSRLVRSWTHLERQRGGAGFTGGPGESQIELDRRMIRDRITSLKKQLEKVVRTRGLHRNLRESVPYPVVALVGYTNAGKSTLFNRLSNADVYAQDALFATLDPTTRKIALPSGRDVLLSDTVGFISNLPTQLIAAFRATLEEVRQADVLLHVRDITHDDTSAQRDDVLNVIESLFDEGEDIPPMIEVWNKIDLADDPALLSGASSAIPLSAITGEGVDALLDVLDAHIAESFYRKVRFAVDTSDGKAQSWLYAHGVVGEVATDNAQMIMEVELNAANIQRFTQQFGYAVLQG